MHLKNVGPIRHCEPPHAHSPCVASGTVARRLHIDVHDIANDNDNDNAWPRGPLWPHGMGPIICFPTGLRQHGFLLYSIKPKDRRLNTAAFPDGYISEVICWATSLQKLSPKLQAGVDVYATLHGARRACVWHICCRDEIYNFGK